MTDKETDELIRFVYGNTFGQNIVEADSTLDEARRTLWAAAFTGRAIPDQLQGPAYIIARRLAHLPLDRVAEVLEQVRLAMWQAAFPNATPNLFGGLLDTVEGHS